MTVLDKRNVISFLKIRFIIMFEKKTMLIAYLQK